MPSPFPGMDPYLEAPGFWPGFHTSMLSAIRAALTPQLPPGFFAELEQHVWFREEEPRSGVRHVKPDVYVTEGQPPPGRKKPGVKGALVLTEPTARVTLPAVVREIGQHTVRIRDARNRRVVTAIELLSPSNKEPGMDRDRYLMKRNEFVANGTSLVEIDLLRHGHRVPVGPVPDGDYYVYVTEEAFYDRVNLWVATVREPLPTVPVPLPNPHPPIALALRACVDRVYEEANYGPQIDYAAATDPPLRKGDAEWAVEHIQRTRKPKK